MRPSSCATTHAAPRGTDQRNPGGERERLMATETMGLHDDRCATRKGHRCNCPSAVFEKPSQHPAAGLKWNIVARLRAEGEGFSASVNLADEDDAGRPVWGIVIRGGETITGRGRSELESLRFVQDELRKRQLRVTKPWWTDAWWAAHIFDQGVWKATLQIQATGFWSIHSKRAHVDIWIQDQADSVQAACEDAYDQWIELSKQRQEVA